MLLCRIWTPPHLLASLLRCGRLRYLMMSLSDQLSPSDPLSESLSGSHVVIVIEDSSSVSFSVVSVVISKHHIHFCFLIKNIDIFNKNKCKWINMIFLWSSTAWCCQWRRWSQSKCLLLTVNITVKISTWMPSPNSASDLHWLRCLFTFMADSGQPETLLSSVTRVTKVSEIRGGEDEPKRRGSCPGLVVISD